MSSPVSVGEQRRVPWSVGFTLAFLLPQVTAQWQDWLLPADMVDMESPLCPLSPLEAEDLESPLSEYFLQEMGTIQDISRSLGEDSSGSFGFPEYQYLGSGPGSDGSVITGECAARSQGARLEACSPGKHSFAKRP